MYAEHKNCLKKKLEGLSAMPRSQATSFALFINYCYCLKERLEIEPKFIASNSFVRDLNIFNLILTAAEFPEVGFAI